MFKKCNNKSETQPGLAVRQLPFGSLSFAILHNSLDCLTVRMLYFSNQPPASLPPPKVSSSAFRAPCHIVCAVSLLISSAFSVQFHSPFICIFTYFLMQFNYFISNPNQNRQGEREQGMGRAKQREGGSEGRLLCLARRLMSCDNSYPILMN